MHLPLVELELAGLGRTGTAGARHVDGRAARAQRYVGHDEAGDLLTVRTHGAGVRVSSFFQRYGDVLRCWAEVTAEEPVVLEQVSSFVIGELGALLGADRWDTDLTLWAAANPWSGELRWSGRTLADLGLPDVGMTRFGQTGTKNRVAYSSAGSWPSGEHLPMGWITGPRATLAWQIEHNGGWHAEVGDRHGDAYLLLSGPTHRECGWSEHLDAGESFRSVQVAVCLVEGGAERALGALTAYRRAIRDRTETTPTCRWSSTTS